MELDNVKVSPYDNRDRVANLPRVKTPPSVDLMEDVFEVENQEYIGSCTANAGCSALELLYKKKKMPVDLSRLFLYYYTRELGGLKGKDGAYPRDIGKALKTYGVCKEETWDYKVSDVDTIPNETSKKEATQYIITSYEQLTGDKLAEIKNSLAQNIPVLLTMPVHKSFYDLGNKWKNHTWDLNSKLLGLHEVLIIGYDDAAKRLLCVNSWGPDWADGGFFGIPYDLIKDVVLELWILHPNYNVKFSKFKYLFSLIKPTLIRHKSMLFIITAFIALMATAILTT